MIETGVVGLKFAPTVWLEFNVTTHVPVPEHAPVHPENTYPLFGLADKVTCVPALDVCEQVEPQLIAPPAMVPFVGGVTVRV